MLVLFQRLALKKYQIIFDTMHLFSPVSRGITYRKKPMGERDPDVIHLLKHWMVKQLVRFFCSEFLPKALGRYSEQSCKRTEAIAKFEAGGERNLKRSVLFSVLLLPWKTRHCAICYDGLWNLTSRRFYSDCIMSIM